MLKKIVASATAALLSAWAAEAAPLEAYGRLPGVEQAELSPSGKFVALVQTDGEDRTIVIKTTADLKTTFIGRLGSAKLRALAWAGDNHLIATTSTTTQPRDVWAARGEWLLAHDLNLTTGRLRTLMENVRSGSDRDRIDAMNTISGSPVVRMISGKPVVFLRGQYMYNNKGRRGLFRVDLDAGSEVLVQTGGRPAYDWVVDAGGEPVAQALYNDSPGVWTLIVRNGSGDWRTAQVSNAPIDTPDIEGLGRDGKSVLLATPDEERGTTWREVSLETGTSGDPLPGDAQGAIFDPATGRWIGQVAETGDSIDYNFFDSRDAATWRAVVRAFPGDIVSLASWSDDRKKILVRVDSAELGPAYAIVDLTTRQADWLAAEYPALKEGDISPVKPVRYKAADGLEITGYLTLPRGREAKNLPLVLLVHGGPASRDRPGFDWWAQALASRGYAVLQANYRGSDGLGASFHRAGFGEFGRKMQTDLSDGVRDLARQGLVDPKRVCIVGGSYGGYAALAGVTLDRGIYRCAASYAGPADLRSLLADSARKGGRDSLRYWQRFIGARDSSDPVLDKVSPAAHAAEVNVPLLMIHGRDDTVVPVWQSRKMASALKDADKPVELIELEGEDHWLSRGGTRLQMLKAMVDFLERNNPPT